MKKPGADYNWDDAVGKSFHDFAGYASVIASPSPLGTITRVSGSRVYYMRHFHSSSRVSQREDFCSKKTVSLVEVTEAETDQLVAAYAIRGSKIRAAQSEYNDLVLGLCGQGG